MSHSTTQKPERYIGLDVHKNYLVAAGVDAEHNQVLPFRRVSWSQLEAWIEGTLTPRDAVVLEMTTNTWEVYDRLVGRVHSITVVHPPHVKLIVKAPVMNDRKAALILANELADDRLKSIWVPPQDVRDRRMLVAERRKMVRLLTQAKNRLHAVLHRHHLSLPEGSEPFHPKHEEFWMTLPLPATELVTVKLSWSTIQFAVEQKALLEEEMARITAGDERIPLLVQLPGVGWQVAFTVLAAIGEVERFPTAKHLVGYAGLGVRVHDSGQTSRRGGITKRGRRDLRSAMVTAANHAIRHHPYWKEWYEARVHRLGRPKTLVAIARKLLVAVWHVLTKREADRHANEVQVARAFFRHVYKVGRKHFPQEQSALAYTRYHLDRIGLGQKMTHLPYGSKRYRLPESSLTD